MELLSDDRIKYILDEIKHYEESVEMLKNSAVQDDRTVDAIEQNMAKIQSRRDQLLVMEAIKSISIEHCNNVGIDIVELVGAIRRITW